jgi:hypothetical protein
MFGQKTARKRPKRDRIGITAIGLGLEQDPRRLYACMALALLRSAIFNASVCRRATTVRAYGLWATLIAIARARAADVAAFKSPAGAKI